jgi:hypothetical protein
MATMTGTMRRRFSRKVDMDPSCVDQVFGDSSIDVTAAY